MCISLYRVGFRCMTLSNVEPLVDADAKTEPMPGADITLLYADLGKLPVADASDDLVVAHEVLHHCRSPLLSRCCALVAERLSWLKLLYVAEKTYWPLRSLHARLGRETRTFCGHDDTRKVRVPESVIS
jgi:hypothetical protein